MTSIKRISDIVLSLTGLLASSPILVIIAAIIKISSAGPVFFRQERAGKDGAVFKIYKFRTMVENAEKIGPGLFIEKNDPRITRVGRFLRAASLDELPQLINVLCGQMSLVGPRPTLPYQVEQYDERQRQRLSVDPGVTGWAQVNGRNNLSWPEKIELDLWYVENRSFCLDLKILWKTLLVIFKKDDLYSKHKYDSIAGTPPRQKQIHD